MKKTILFAAMMLGLSFGINANAQIIKNGDFETGDLTGWKVWANKTNSMVDASMAHSGKNAVDVRVGMFTEFNLNEGPKVTYELTAYTNFLWGEEQPYLLIEYYNPDSKKLEEIKRVDVPTRKGFQKVTVKFKSPKKAYVYRVTAVPYGQKGASFILDDVSLVKINK